MMEINLDQIEIAAERLSETAEKLRRVHLELSDVINRANKYREDQTQDQIVKSLMKIDSRCQELTLETNSLYRAGEKILTEYRNRERQAADYGEGRPKRDSSFRSMDLTGIRKELGL